MKWLKFLGVLSIVVSIIVMGYLCTNHSRVGHEIIRVTPIHEIVTVLPEATQIVKEFQFETGKGSDCVSSCSIKSQGRNYTSPKVLVIGASTFIGSSIALRLHKEQVEVIAVETQDIHLLNSLQFNNWEQLLSQNLDTLIVQSTDIISALDELKHIDQIIYVPRNVFDCVLDTNIFKEDGTQSLEFLVNVLEAIKNVHSDIRVTLITKPQHRLTCMQSAWLKTLETSIQAYSNLHGLKVGFIRVDGVINEMQETEYGSHLLDEIHCVAVDTDSRCLDLSVVLETNEQPPLSAAEKNIRQKNAVMSTYFTTIQNPQYAVTIAKNMFKFMQDWLISANRLGIQAIIFHDSFNDGFIARIKEKYDNVVFKKVVGFKGRTPNDYRFYLQYDYLQNHPEISNIILSDIRDITFFNDPFEVMHVLGSSNVYVGMDVSYYTSSWSHAYPRGLINACYRKDANTITVTSDPFFNAGVIGSTRQLMLKYLKHVTDSLNHTPRGRNCNMATIAIVTHTFFRGHDFSGYPFQSAFKMDIPGPQGLAVKHKIEHKNL